MYMTAVDGRVRSVQDIENLTITTAQGHPIHLKDFARVLRGKEPTFSVVTADGVDSVLLNIYSQPDASTLDIALQLQRQLPAIRKELPPDVKLAFFYDQSLLVRDSMLSAWEAIIFGLFLSIAILYLFLRSWGTTLVATVVIPVTVLLTILVMKLCGMNFNLMTLGGIAAAIGLIIDDAIVVVEAIYAKIATGMGRLAGDPCGHRGDICRAARFDPDARCGVYPAGVSQWHRRRLFPRPGTHDGRVVADLAAAGADADAVPRCLVHPHPSRKEIARPSRGGAGRVCVAAGSSASTNSSCGWPWIIGGSQWPWAFWCSSLRSSYTHA